MTISIVEEELPDDEVLALLEGVEDAPVRVVVDEDELTNIVRDYMPLVRHAVNRVMAGSSQSLSHAAAPGRTPPSAVSSAVVSA